MSVYLIGPHHEIFDESSTNVQDFSLSRDDTAAIRERGTHGYVALH